MKVESTVSAALLHREGVTVTRRFTLPRARDFELTALPVSLEDGSLRVRPSSGSSSGSSGVSVVALRVSLEEGTLRASPREVAEERRSVHGAIQTLAAEQAELDFLLGSLGSIEPGARPMPHTGDPPRATVRGRLALLSASDSVARSFLEERAALEKELTRLRIRAEELRLAEEELDARRAATPLSKSLHVHLSRLVDSEGLMGEVSYFVRSAGWCPTYTLRLSGSRAVVEVRASIAQRTGESWEDVDIAVTTAEASTYVDLPDLESLRIGRRQRKVRRGYRPVPSNTADLFADFQRFVSVPSEVSVPTDYGAIAEESDGEATPVEDPLGAASRATSPQDAFGAASMAMPMGGGVGGPPGMGGAPPAPAMPMSSRSFAQFEARASKPQGAAPARAPLARTAEPPRAESPVEPEPRWLAFDTLRLPPPDVSRGKLVARDRRALYLEGLSDGGLARRVDEAISPRLGLANSPPRHAPPPADIGFHHRIRGRSKVTVPSDGYWHAVPLLAETVPAKRSCVVVPRESTDVFRRVELMNPFDLPLLAGPCDVYVDDEFLTTTELETVPPRGALAIGTGVEQAIKVARNTTFREAAEGLMSGTTALHHQVSVDVRSHLDAPIEIEVRERVPVIEEREEHIKIEVAEVRPAWAPLPAKPKAPVVRGAHRWVLALAPGEAASLLLRYVIRISSKSELVDGNRREP
jgi:hypothetical protein